MSSEEDAAALLYLVFEHLKMSGYKKAAKALEKHVAQVETPEESSNLQDIYTSWNKLCSLAQHAKQEAEDSATVKKKSIKPEPASSAEEEEEKVGGATKLADVTEENDAGAKPPPESATNGVGASDAELPAEERNGDAVSEEVSAGETKTMNGEEEEEEEDEEVKRPLN
ncbi:Treacle protein [Liparis tanakae]|uniref:Treacle protein n=1 Tax=Liparis tanakae TaxID=230148 RepID=A0A4Z2G474_9TELE|nr:Treacle protein [Liparis tanakae]